MNMALEMNELNEIIRKVTEEVCNRYGVCNAPAAPAAGGAMDPASLAKYIDHTLLKPEASVEDIKKVCDEAKKTRDLVSVSTPPISAMWPSSSPAAM